MSAPIASIYFRAICKIPIREIVEPLENHTLPALQRAECKNQGYCNELI
jgi:hypothetical protein